MTDKTPDGDNPNLAWLGAAMSQTQTDAITGVAAVVATFYRKLAVEGVPDESAGMLTESYMMWLLDRAAEAGGRER